MTLCFLRRESAMKRNSSCSFQINEMGALGRTRTCAISSSLLISPGLWRSHPQDNSNRCTENQLLSTIANDERASYNGSIEASQASDTGSIPVARSINSTDAVGFTGFLLDNSPPKAPVLDAVGREFSPKKFNWTRRIGADRAQIAKKFLGGFTLNVRAGSR
jgi:hypothetical protein